MRIILLIILFIACCVAISKAIAVLIPASLFYSLASALHIYGDESVIDFMLIANVTLSVLLSLALVFLFRRKRSLR